MNEEELAQAEMMAELWVRELTQEFEEVYYGIDTTGTSATASVRNGGGTQAVPPLR